MLSLVEFGNFVVISMWFLASFVKVNLGVRLSPDRAITGTFNILSMLKCQEKPI